MLAAVGSDRRVLYKTTSAHTSHHTTATMSLTRNVDRSVTICHWSSAGKVTGGMCYVSGVVQGKATGGMCYVT